MQCLNFYIVKDVILLSLVLLATYSDLRTRKIPNKLTINGILLGLLLCITTFAWSGGSFNLVHLGQGLLFSLGGILLAFGLGILPFMAGGLGGGDVKLLIMIGAFMGPQFTLWTALYTAICGGTIALFFIVKRFLKKEKLFAGFFSFATDYWQHLVYKTELVNTQEKQEKFPYSLAILGGVVLAFLNII